MQKNLSTLSKMKDFYKLDHNEIQRSKTFLLSNQNSPV
jgi:hypothetical protein